MSATCDLCGHSVPIEQIESEVRYYCRDCAAAHDLDVPLCKAATESILAELRVRLGVDRSAVLGAFFLEDSGPPGAAAKESKDSSGMAAPGQAANCGPRCGRLHRRDRWCPTCDGGLAWHLRGARVELDSHPTLGPGSDNPNPSNADAAGARAIDPITETWPDRPPIVDPPGDIATAPTDYALPVGSLEQECIRLAARVEEIERAHEAALSERDAAHSKLESWVVEGAQLVQIALEAGNRTLDLQTTVAMLLRRIRERNIVIKELSKGSIDLGPGPHHAVDDPSTHVFYMLWQNAAHMAQHYAHLCRHAFRERNSAYKYSRRQDKDVAKLGRKVGVLRAVARHWQREEETARRVKRKTVNAYVALNKVCRREHAALKIALENQLTLNGTELGEAIALLAQARWMVQCETDYDQDIVPWLARLEALGVEHVRVPEATAQMQRLTEATALLERCRTGEATDAEIAAWLSRAPTRAATPATPAPEGCTFIITRHGDRIDLGAEPPAPEASTDPAGHIYTDTRPEAGARADLKECEARLHEQWTMRQTLIRRLETAEAQLAAVRAWALNQVDDTCIGTRHCFACELLALLRPGGGTGGGK